MGASRAMAFEDIEGDIMTPLSEHFTLEEMCASATARELGIDNAAPAEVVPRLAALCVYVLEPVRALVGRPVTVHSGWRCPELNRAVGGVPSSQHMLGEAVDLTVDGLSNMALAAAIRDSAIEFDQLILESHHKDAPASGWVHVSRSSGETQRREVLTMHLGKYEHGLVEYA